MVKFGQEARGQPQKSCELCKVMKGVDNPAWNMHDTSVYRSKAYYKKRMMSVNTDEPKHKKYKKTYKGVMSNYAVKK